MKTEDIKKLAQILSDMREASLKGNQHKLDVDKDGDIEADDLADLRKGKKAKNEVVTKYTTGGRKLNWQAKKAIKKLSDKEVDEVKYVPGFVGADGKATSKPTAKDYAANKEYQSMKKRLGDRIPGPKPTKEEAAYGRFHMESIRASIQKMWEAATGNSQSPHAGSEETKDSKEKQLKRSAGEKAFVDAHKVNTVDGAKDASDSIEKANASNKVAPKRKNDNKQGDMKIMNKPEDITAKGKG